MTDALDRRQVALADRRYTAECKLGRALMVVVSPRPIRLPVPPFDVVRALAV